VKRPNQFISPQKRKTNFVANFVAYFAFVPDFVPEFCSTKTRPGPKEKFAP
jgi:hypothetical protein